MTPDVSECYFWSFRGTSCLANNSRLDFVKLVHYDGTHAVCQNSFLRRGRVNSVLCIRFRSLMNLIIHLPRLRDICNCLCFVCIAVGGEDCMISFFTFFFFCHQSSFCNRILISCLNHMRQHFVCTPSLCVHTRLSLFLCDESSRNSSVSKEHLFHLNVFGSHEYCWIQHLYLHNLQVLSWTLCDGGNALNPHAWILLQLILESSSQYWKNDSFQ